MSNEPLSIDHLLATAAEQLGVPLALGQSGACTIEFERGLQVTLAVPEQATHLALLAPLIDAPVDAVPMLLAEALRLNLDFALTRGASIGLDSFSERLVLRYWYPLTGADGLNIANVLTNFVATAYRLHDRLHELAERLVTPSDSGLPPNFLQRV